METLPRGWLRREGEGPPLVLLHGSGANASVWTPVLAELGAFDVLAPSLPGRDGSPPEPLEDAGLAAEWLARVLREIGGPPPLILGHSYGGAIGIELALRGGPVAGLVLVSCGARLRVHPMILAEAERAVETGDRLPVGFAFLDHADADAVKAYGERSAATPPAATLADWRACDGFDRLGELGSVDVPVLVVAGREDALTPPKYQTTLVEQLPRAQIAWVEGAGHMLPWEAPAALARAVRAWAAGAISTR